MSNYPSNLPDSTPYVAPAVPVTQAPQSTYDTIQNRGPTIDNAVNTASGITRGTSNPDNNLPAASFHKAPRGFGNVRNTPF